MSLTGAALDVSSPFDVPEHFTLAFRAEGVHIEVQIVWRKERRIESSTSVNSTDASRSERRRAKGIAFRTAISDLVSLSVSRRTVTHWMLRTSVVDALLGGTPTADRSAQSGGVERPRQLGFQSVYRVPPGDSQ